MNKNENKTKKPLNYSECNNCNHIITREQENYTGIFECPICAGKMCRLSDIEEALNMLQDFDIEQIFEIWERNEKNKEKNNDEVFAPEYDIAFKKLALKKIEELDSTFDNADDYKKTFDKLNYSYQVDITYSENLPVSYPEKLRINKFGISVNGRNLRKGMTRFWLVPAEILGGFIFAVFFLAILVAIGLGPLRNFSKLVFDAPEGLNPTIIAIPFIIAIILLIAGFNIGINFIYKRYTKPLDQILFTPFSEISEYDRIANKPNENEILKREPCIKFSDSKCEMLVFFSKDSELERLLRKRIIGSQTKIINY